MTEGKGPDSVPEGRERTRDDDKLRRGSRMGVKPNSTGDGSRRAADEGIYRCRPRKESQIPVRGSETGGRRLSGRMTAVRMKPGRERRRRTRRSRPVAARTKSGALPRCCGKAHAHLAKLISRSHTGRRRPREGSRSALFDFATRKANARLEFTGCIDRPERRA